MRDVEYKARKNYVCDNCAYLSDGECDFDDEFKCDCAEKDCPRVEKG